MERINRYNTADRLIGDIFEAWCTAMEQRPELKMVYVHSLFATLDAVFISFDIITEEEYLNSADPSSELYDARNSTINMSKQIREYLDFAINGINDKKATREASEKGTSEDTNVIK